MTWLRRLAVALRGPDWFFSKLPALLFLAIAAAAMTDPSPRSIAKKSLVWLASIVAMAVIGYVVNDHYDRDSDARSGRLSSALPPRGVVAACAAALLVQSLLLVIGRPFAFAAALLSNAVALAYSAPPLRLKERGAAGIAADAVAAWLAPMAVLLGVAWPPFPFVTRPQALFAACAMVWALLYGVRGIVVHQLWDKRRDAASGLRTFVVHAGAENARRLVRGVLFPIEIVALAGLIATAGFGLRARIAVAAAYVAWDIFRRWRWGFKLDPAPPVRAYVVGAELVELWLPLLQVALLVEGDRGHFYFAVAWLMLFHRALIPRLRELGDAAIGLVRDLTRRLRWAVVTGASLLALEAVLQGGSYAIWLRNRPEAPAAEGNAVLCVGDSFTYGFAASDRTKSYPAQLQSLAGPSVRVINRGWPGQNSYDVVSGLRELLRTTRPRVVYLIAGANDGWSRAGIYAAGEGRGDGFELRWRTLRLARVLLTRAWQSGSEATVASAAPMRPSPAAPAAANAPFGGTWYSGAEPVTFGADGVLQYGDAGTRVHYEARGDTMVLVHPLMRRVLHWRRDGERLIVHCQGIEQPWVLTRTLQERSARCSAGDPLALAAGWTALQRGDLDRADDCFHASAHGLPSRAAAGAGLVALYLRRDLRERAAAELANVERLYTAEPGPLTAQALVDATVSMSSAKGIERARAMLAVYPENASLWKTLGWYSFLEGDMATARKGIDNAIRFSAGLSADERAYYYFIRAEITRRVDADGALRDALLSFAERADDGTLRSGLRDATEERLERALAASALPEATRAHVRDVFRDLAAPDHVLFRRVLAANLRTAVAECRRAGAAIVLASYPFQYGDVDEAMRRVGAEANVPWINVHAEFERRLQGRPRSDLFVPDGHCNDRGYALMAQIISHDLRERMNAQGDAHGSRRAD